MSEFKIDSDIPYRDIYKNIDKPIIRRRRSAKCRTSTHIWESVGPGKDKCLKCGDVFPCKTPCDHVDCNDPEFYTPDTPDITG